VDDRGQALPQHPAGAVLLNFKESGRGRQQSLAPLQFGRDLSHPASGHGARRRVARSLPDSLPADREGLLRDAELRLAAPVLHGAELAALQDPSKDMGAGEPTSDRRRRA